MAQHVWSVLCQHPVVDKRTNRVSLLNTTEQVTVLDPEQILRKKSASDNEWLNHELWVASLWRWSKKAPEEARTCVRIFDPSGDRVKGEDQWTEIDFTKSPRARTFLGLPGVPLQGEGTYTFKVILLESGKSRPKTVAQLPLELRFVDELEELQAARGLKP